MGIGGNPSRRVQPLESGATLGVGCLNLESGTWTWSRGLGLGVGNLDLESEATLGIGGSPEHERDSSHRRHLPVGHFAHAYKHRGMFLLSLLMLLWHPQPKPLCGKDLERNSASGRWKKSSPSLF